jgi:hypothetical protein
MWYIWSNTDGEVTVHENIEDFEGWDYFEEYGERDDNVYIGILVDLKPSLLKDEKFIELVGWIGKLYASTKDGYMDYDEAFDSGIAIKTIYLGFDILDVSPACEAQKEFLDSKYAEMSDSTIEIRGEEKMFLFKNFPANPKKDFKKQIKAITKAGFEVVIMTDAASKIN